MKYTLELYRKDRRVKTGERLVEKVDLGDITFSEADAIVLAKELQGFRAVMRETYVTRKNLMTGNEFQERYDTPRYCSPAFESYWSM